MIVKEATFLPILPYVKYNVVYCNKETIFCAFETLTYVQLYILVTNWSNWIKNFSREKFLIAHLGLVLFQYIWITSKAEPPLL